MIIKITKLEELPNAEVPNNKEVGYEKIGEFVDSPKVGEPFYVYPIKMSERGLRTSIVTEVLDENTFKTLNSIYRWEEVPVGPDNRPLNV